MNSTNPRQMVDPDLLSFLDVVPALVLSDEALAAARAEPRLPMPTPDTATAAAAVEITVRTVPGPDGAPDVGIIIYRPADAAQALPCALHFHGGGFVMGSAAASEGPHRMVSALLGCVIITVDYRLAPETVFPGAVEDAYAVLAWTVANAAVLKIDPSRIGVAGESAGGGLAAALALMARDRGRYPLAFQHLTYPMLDDRTCAASDPHPHTGAFIWTAHNNRFGWRALLGAEPGGDAVSPYAAPARAADLAALPPTYIATGGLDLFLEEDLEYARRLMRAGVAVELHVYPGAFHAFELAPAAAVSAQATRDSLTALKRLIAPASRTTASV